MSIFTPALDFLHDLFHSAGKAVSALSLALARTLAANGGELLAHAAMQAVAAAETAPGSGRDKFAAAQAAVVAELTTAGVPVVLHAVNAAVESAVAAAKFNQAAG